VGVEVRFGEHLLVDLHLLVQFEAIGNGNLYDAIEDGLVRVLALETVPLRLITMGDDYAVEVQHVRFARRGNPLLLCGGDDRMEELDLVLEHLDELYDATVSNVEGTIEREGARIVLSELVQLGDVDRSDEDRYVL